tara:strand:+ start:2660 stop:3040 length:381 start_codon:yes stop_codon:yes gene_type:complete
MERLIIKIKMGILTRLILGKDDYLFNNLKDNQKLAFCRIVTEVIQADGIVISKELDELPEIPKAFMANSKKLSFEEAIETLKSMDEEYQEFIREELKQIEESDGYASNEERKVVNSILNQLDITIL